MISKVIQSKVDALRLSVVIPLYNHGIYIETAIQSVLSQSVPVDEIIVIDDGSTDNSADKVRQLCQKHPQIIFWSWANQGAHHTLNAGILRATGDFIAILNSDDSYAPERLAACLEVVRVDPSVDVVASVVSFQDNKGNVVLNPWYDDALAFYKSENDIPLALFHANFLVTTSNLFIRRSVFESIGLFAPLRYTHDLEYTLRLILGKKTIHFIDQPLLNYRLHDTNTISENKIQQDIERAAIFAFFLYRQWGYKVGGGVSSISHERYVDILAQQDILEIVENFLSLLGAPSESAMMEITKSLAIDFKEFLSKLGLDWVGQLSTDFLLVRFEVVRNVQLRRQQNAQIFTKLQVDSQWWQQQANSWEKTANENRQSNIWLEQQRDAWEKRSIQKDRTIEALQTRLHECSQALADRDATLARLRGNRGLRLINLLAGGKLFGNPEKPHS